MRQTPDGTGWVELICGPMFSGKTGELLRRLRRAELAKLPIQLFKPYTDNRYSATDVVSHDQIRREASVVRYADELAAAVRHDTRVVGIDETQFFDERIVTVVDQLAACNIVVILACLDQDWRGAGFEFVPELMARAESVSKLSAICVVCGNPASRTQRVVGGIKQVEVGGAEAYEARCRRCHEVL